MKAELKAKWLTALRSGKYRQTQKTLRSHAGDTFCCLGVLCDVVNPQGWDAGSHELGDEEGVEIAADAMEELEISPEAQSVLIDLNDGDGDHPPRNFSFIADYIEKSL